MANGSFNGLYTFEEIAKIYGMDSSTLRKMVQHSKFGDNEIKKFGKTWIITEQAVKKHFGLGMLQMYNNELKLKEIQELRELKRQNQLSKSNKRSVTKTIKKDFNDISGDDEIIPELSEFIVDPRSVKASFNFNK